ncbi:MAG: phosphoribosylglycinamide synthetase C domain-containing protein [Planctomycetota bacterium]
MVTALGPRLIEFNCRFGDPEAQVLMMRMKSDIVPYLDAIARGELDELRHGPEWEPWPAACVVAVSEGYPGKYEKGRRIENIYEHEDTDDLVIFHAGTERRIDGHCYTSGGRVFAVTAKAPALGKALDKCYGTLERVRFAGMGYRTDIGRRG